MTAYVGNNPVLVNPPAGPATRGWNVVASDTVPLPNPTNSIFVNTGGTLALQLANVLPGAPGVINLTVVAGQYLNICATFVMATGTTASVTALW